MESFVSAFEPLFASPLSGSPAHPRSSQWSHVRDQFLSTHHSCEACGSKVNLEVHHVYPFSWPDGHKTELDPNNFMVLCANPSHNCHLWVGHLGDFQSRNPNAREDASAFLKKIQNRPYQK